ncbi:MAG: hypothetical protein AAB658_08100, partial [Chloroflexota bacterium]
MRIDYPLLENASTCATYRQSFVGAPGYSPYPSLPPNYAVTAVYEGGVETTYSNSVRAYTDATVITEATTNSSPLNTEFPGGAFPAFDPNTVLVPGAPQIFSWSWMYGAATEAEGCVGPAQGNWALMKWSAPVGAPNEYRLLRQAGPDPNYYEMALDFIPGDDEGMRQFIWNLPRELACQ